MDYLIKSINSLFVSTNIHDKDIESVYGVVNERMKLFGWILLELNGDKCLIANINFKEVIVEGCLLNKEEVLEIIGRDTVVTVNGTADKASGIRFEGSVLEGNPFGFGSLFDENGNRIYEGMVIDWNRMGYGVSFNENGLKEYEGYWCNDLRCGNGKLFDVKGSIVYEGNWIKGVREDQYEGAYEGDGSNLNIKVKHLKLINNCILKCFDVSLFTLLEELVIGDECFQNNDVFRIDGLKHLKSITIGRNSFNGMLDVCTNEVAKSMLRNKRDCITDDHFLSRSFHVLNCPKLESIDISDASFFDFGGEFELKNLPALAYLKIGEFECESLNFCSASFTVENLPSLRSIEIGDYAFAFSLSTVISNLPNLVSMHIGEEGLVGSNDESCTLVMKDLPNLEFIISNGWSFQNPRSVTLSNIPILKVVDLLDAFQHVERKSVTDVSPLLADYLDSCFI